MSLYDEYEFLRLKEMFADTPSEEKQAAADVEEFERQHPDIEDEVYTRARTGYNI